MNPKILEGIFAFKPEQNDGSFEKFLAGRLLQAGWHSPQAVKEEGIKRAVAQLGSVQDHISEISKSTKIPVPKLVVDFVLMVLSEFFFGSTFLVKEAQNIIFRMLEQETVSRDELLQALALFWAVQRLLAPDKRDELVSGYLDKLKNAGIAAEDQGRFLLLLKIVEKADPSLTRTLKRKLDKQFNALLRRARPVIRGLLPEKNKKWRVQITG